jgi:2,3-bisphosphoglycerate-independent phosphoglycerate mutase
MNKEKVYLMILDGFGEGKDYPGNAEKLAHMKNLEALKSKYPWTLLQASGNAVGLPENTQGGSEVGHFTIGAGRIVFQSLEEINQSIHDGSFFLMPSLVEAMEKVKNTPKTALHLLGMISDSGIHSHLNHLFALLYMAKTFHIGPVYIHAITDGRDVPEKTAKLFIEQIQKKITELGFSSNPEDTENYAGIATIIGRFYAMDRDTNWDRTKKAYDLYTQGIGTEENDPLQAIDNAYARNIETDYYIDPIILNKNGRIKEQDSVIFWNYRTDRTRQITYCFTGEEDIGFEINKTVHPFFVCFGDYSKKAPVVFPTQKITNNLGEVLEKQQLKQLRIAETEKYAHVTYFFNSQVDEPFAHETRVLIDSPKVSSYAEKPEMSAPELTERVLKEMDTQDYDLIVQNFANPDLVGHSGDLQASIQACKVIDDYIQKIVEKALQKGYHVILTADHGNVEYKIYENNGEPCPSHTTNPVICLLISPKYKDQKLAANKGLQDIAPTILEIMNIPQPIEMTGTSLLK